jgi:hypothetical protein
MRQRRRRMDPLEAELMQRQRTEEGRTHRQRVHRRPEVVPETRWRPRLRRPPHASPPAPAQSPRIGRWAPHRSHRLCRRAGLGMPDAYTFTPALHLYAT